jgi:protein ImuB
MERRFVSIWFPHLSTDWFTLRKPELKNIPFVLTQPSHGRMVITAANPLAQQHGLLPGMALADARAILPSLQAYDNKPALAAQLIQRIAEWCIRFTPVAAPDGSDGIILDASGCTHLWGNEKAYVTDIVNRIYAKGYCAKAAIADTIGTAWAIARFRKEHVSIVEAGKQTEAILYLPPAALRLESEVIDKLNKLGLRQIKDFISMPRSALRRRFGNNMILRIHQALGVEEEIIQPVYPVEPYQERLPCLEPIATRTGIEIALERLLEALCNRLKKEGKGLRMAYFRGYRTDSGAQGIEISTSRPSNHVQHLFSLFSLKLSTIEPGLGIELFVLEATKVESHLPGQEMFWKGSGGLHDTGLSELIDRLTGKLGAESVHRYLPVEHHLPERSIKKNIFFRRTTCNRMANRQTKTTSNFSHTRTYRCHCTHTRLSTHEFSLPK